MGRPTTKGLARRSSLPCEYGKLRTLQAAAIQSLQVLFKGASDFAGYTDFVGCELWSGGSSPGLTRCLQKLSRIPRLFCLRYAELGSGVLAFLIYRRWGFSSMLSWRIAWGMQGQPIYRQVRDRVVAMMFDGVHKEGDSLPSVRNVAAEYRVNPLTVLKGYQQLVDEGLVDRGIGNRPVTGLGGPDTQCRFRRVQHQRDILQCRLNPLFLPVFQIEIHPQDPVSVRRIRLGRGDGHVFWKSDFSRILSDAPIWLDADGHRRSHNRLLADVVCGKDQSP